MPLFTVFVNVDNILKQVKTHKFILNDLIPTLPIVQGPRSHILVAKRDFLGSMKDSRIFLGCKKNTGIFLGVAFFISSIKSMIA